MDSGGFALAATTNDLSREAQVRDAADILEFRMDKAEDPLTELSEYNGDLAILATNRSQWAGGEAPDDGRLDDLLGASEFDAVEMVDIELETARDNELLLTEFRENDVEVIVSYHDFDETPDQATLDAIFDKCAQYGDIAKVATYAEDHYDTLRMLQSVHSATIEGEAVAGISMGALGSHTRVVAPLYGSKLGYAPLETDTSEYAPGQIPIHDLASMIETLNAAEQETNQPPPTDEESSEIQNVADTEEDR